MPGNILTLDTANTPKVQRKINYVGTLTNTTPVQVSAASAGVRNCVTGFQYQNTNATASQIQLLDGSTPILTLNAPANMSLPAILSFADDLPSSSTNAALNVKAVTTAANILVNIQGHTEI